MKDKAAGRLTKNMAAKNAYRAEQLLGIRKIHDPDERAVAESHPYQYATENDALIGIIKKTLEMERRMQNRHSFIPGATPEMIINAFPEYATMSDKKRGTVVYNGPDTNGQIGGVQYRIRKGDTFSPIRGGLYNKKAKHDEQKLERLQLKREEIQEQFNDGFK